LFFGVQKTLDRFPGRGPRGICRECPAGQLKKAFDPPRTPRSKQIVSETLLKAKSANPISNWKREVASGDWKTGRWMSLKHPRRWNMIQEDRIRARESRLQNKNRKKRGLVRAGKTVYFDPQR